jgi:hypothetical protein
MPSLGYRSLRKSNVLFFADQLQGQGIAWDYFVASGKSIFISTLEGITTVSRVNIQSLDHQKVHHFFASQHGYYQIVKLKELALKLYRFQKDLIHNGLNCKRFCFRLKSSVIFSFDMWWIYVVAIHNSSIKRI